MSYMATGTVKFYNKKNKFGFIKVDETGEEIYVRASGLVDAIEDNDRVEFEIEQAAKGPMAKQVKKV